MQPYTRNIDDVVTTTTNHSRADYHRNYLDLIVELKKT